MKKNAQKHSGGEILAAYTAFLRGLYLLHQNNHWQTKGKNFFGNHLLFERLYKETSEQADQIAEKTIGLYDSDALNFKNQMSLIKDVISQYSCVNPEQCVQSSLKAEEQFIKLCETVKNKLDEIGELTMGVANLIEELASNAEGRIYLLKGAL
jgi:DNA-binding ferritin-like protein